MYFYESDMVIEGRSFIGGHAAHERHPDGREYHTFRTYTVLADGDRITFKGCYFENSAGGASGAGQAIALYLDGDDICLMDCVIRGHQDTLFLAPLPLKERLKDGFLGPKKDAPRKNHTVYFKNCLIEGGVDFIFGGATAYFDDCEFKSNAPGFVFAPSTPQGVGEGFVARHCRFTHVVGLPRESCFIARPWRRFGRVRLEQCELGEHISRRGWDDWGDKEAHATVHFTEISSTGPGACPQMRPDYVRVIG